MQGRHFFTLVISLGRSWAVHPGERPRIAPWHHRWRGNICCRQWPDLQEKLNVNRANLMAFLSTPLTCIDAVRLDKHTLHKVTRLESLRFGPHSHADLLTNGVAEAWIVGCKEQALIVALCDLFAVVEQLLHLRGVTVGQWSEQIFHITAADAINARVPGCRASASAHTQSRALCLVNHILMVQH